MNPTPQQQRYVGAIILMFLFCIFVPIFISGENVNRDKDAISKLSDPAVRRQYDNQQQLSSQDPVSQNSADQKNTTQTAQTSNPSDSIEEPQIIENNTATTQDPQQQDLVAKRQKQQELEQEKARLEAERKRAERQKEQAIREQQAKRQEEKRRSQEEQDRKRIEANTKKQNTITVIDERNHKKDEIKVLRPEDIAKQRQENNNRKTTATVVQPTGRDGEKYRIKLGAYSSMTNAKNAQAKASPYCVASIMPITVNSQRMFKVICSKPVDMATARSLQGKLSSKFGSATQIEKAN